jgi:hypothetical protein
MAVAITLNLIFWSDDCTLRAAEPLQQQGFVYTCPDLWCCLPERFVLIQLPYRTALEGVQSCQEGINTAIKPPPNSPMACALRLAFWMCIPVPSAVYPPLERLPGLPVTGG